MMIGLFPRAGDQDQREIPLRRRIRSFGAGRFIAGQGIDPDVVQRLGPEFDFTGRRLEPGLFEIAETEIERRPALFLQQIPVDFVAQQIFVEILLGLLGEKFTRIDTAGF